MYPTHRIDDFNGSEAAYIAYLESKLQESRRYASQLQVQLHNSFPHPLDFHAWSPAKITVYPSATLPEHSQNDPNFILRHTPVARLEKSQGNLQGPVREPLKFIEHDVAKLKPKAYSNENVRSRKPAWRGEMDIFCRDIPNVTLWMKKRRELGIHSSEQNRNILARLLDAQFTVPPSPRRISSPRNLSNASTLLECLKAYGSSLRGSLIEAKFATKFASFQELILVSFMVVLVACGIHTNEIDEAMKSCFAANEKKNLERIRSGALWANRCIGRLFESKWGFRSTEIFFSCARSITAYGRFSDYTKESLGDFTKHLVDSRYTTPYQELCGWLPYHIPCAIKILVGDLLTLQQISAFLEYPDSSLEASTSLLCEYECFIKSNRKMKSPTTRRRHKLTFKANTSSVVAQPCTLKRHLSDFQSSNKRPRTTTDRKRKSKGGGSFIAGNARGNAVPHDHALITTPEGRLTGLQDSYTDALGQNTSGELNGDFVPLLIEETQLDTAELPDGTGFDITSVMEFGFDIISIMDLGFDMTSTMDMRFDMTSTMEPQSNGSSPPDKGL